MPRTIAGSRLNEARRLDEIDDSDPARGDYPTMLGVLGFFILIYTCLQILPEQNNFLGLS